MTDITVTAAKVAGQADTSTRSYKAAETITAGQAVYKTTAGLVGLADASTGGGALIQFAGIALNKGYANDPIRVAYRGPVEGFTLTGNVYALIYLSNTAGAVADSSGDVVVPVGRIDMKEDGTKFLWVDTAPLTTWA